MRNHQLSGSGQADWIKNTRPNKFIPWTLGFLVLQGALLGGLAMDTNAQDSLIYPSELNFRNARMLTRGGDNAEAYWNTASNQLVFQSNNPAWGLECDQIFVLDSSRVLPTQGQ
ncbi:MAG: hypothetical protein ACKO9W_01585, partial [Bacteroidota bacterium]